MAAGRYDSPPLECDVVMKGGITSGVIYPLAICELATRYRLRSIGGASAGAIAAAAAAAAEYARQNRREASTSGVGSSMPPGSGFEGLEMLPNEISAPVPGGSSRLQSLFQPTPEARPLFGLIIALTTRAGAWSKAALVLSAIVSQVPGPPLIALAVTVALAANAIAVGGVLIWVPVSVAIAGIWVVGLGVSALFFAGAVGHALGERSGYGVCSGYSPDAKTPPLTTWLADLVDTLAGRPMDGAPLCLGDLKRHGIELVAMTTNVTHGRPYRLPFEGFGTWYFKKSEFDGLFPPRVVDFMVQRSHLTLAQSDAAEARWEYEEVNSHGATDYIPFPAAEDLPVVVVARLSLSFPVLIQAVPLYAVDRTLRRNQLGTVEVDRCWFSDGGACSNLPLHFFDSLLPSRPTFALNLRGPHPDHPIRLPPFEPGFSERNNVWLPTHNASGIAERWTRFGKGHSAFAIAEFLAALLDTMQSWNDQLTSKYPGYRDRVVHINHLENEGGLNLDMPQEVIQRLAQRGKAAGELLVERFDPSVGEGWDNHVWLRYRLLVASLAREAEALNPDRFAHVARLFAHPPSYQFRNKAQASAAERINDALAHLTAELRDAAPPLTDGAPRPSADLRPRPQSS